MGERDAVVFWFRRDLRLEDQKGLSEALRSGLPVIPIFIFDPNILTDLPPDDKRLGFIYQTLSAINRQLHQWGSTLLSYHSDPLAVFELLEDDLTSRGYRIREVYANHDYEPYAIRRDKGVRDLLKGRGINFKTFKDQVIFERSEILKADGEPYTVFTPYAKRWRAALSGSSLQTFETDPGSFANIPPEPLTGLKELGFILSNDALSEPDLSPDLLRDYARQRDFPGLDKTSRIGVHLRFGTVSVRKAVGLAMDHSRVWLNELIWREFFMMILYKFPHVEHASFHPRYDLIPWRNNEAEFRSWCEGNTGYELVDAGMRQLSETGWMHNRVRMVCAGFLCKHLLIDWRWGEAWFAEKLIDYELASNNGNWQWAAGTGCDSAPYFRVFNPIIQAKKFDPEHRYIDRWLPEFHTLRVPPMVDHRFARERALNTYRSVLK